ncbi:MAG: endolytic transglycosylase MltG [Parcubacteria group bacterium]
MIRTLLREKRVYLFAIGFVLFFIYVWALIPPFSFPSGSIITVRDGVGLYVLADNLEEDRVIRSPFWFRIFAVAFGGERGMKAGQYYMAGPQNTMTVAWRIFHGDYQVETVRVTIPEGFTVEKIATLFDERFPFFDREVFEASAKEGYLFPDTYFVPVTATASSTLKLFSENFERKLLPLYEDIESSGRDLDQIINMASILEGEARGQEDMEIVSSILWRRYELGMPLQVDTSFLYVNGKTTENLTLDDLKIDSPYNTYLYKGLPPTPISNPGLISIRAALNPATTTDLYFLTSDDGEMHYSKTFEEHVEKKLKYINRP